jgi:DNA-directed RNA polymerase specialized sigma24 family protein
MSDEARSMWEKFITAPANAALLKRYAKSAQEPAPLFENIGEDLDSSNEEVRNSAFWALVTAMPELTNILHERETRQPGWRDVEGKDQQMVNRGSDILTYLHRKLVKEHRFKISDRYGKDPRSFMNTAISNRKKDEKRKRKRKREVPLDDNAALTIPDPAGSLEDTALESIHYEERKRELRNWGLYRSDDELALFETVHVDKHPFREIRERFGNPSEDALRQQLSRNNKYMVAVRDEVFTSLLFMTWQEFITEGRFPRSARDPEEFEEWEKRAKKSIQPGIWLDGKAADGMNAVAVRALTTGLHGSPGHIYLVAIKKDYQKMSVIELVREKKKHYLWMPPGISNGNGHYNLGNCSRYVEKLINPANEPQRNNYIFYLLKGDLQLPGLNDALDEVPEGYHAWLISNSYSIPKSYSWISITPFFESTSAPMSALKPFPLKACSFL